MNEKKSVENQLLDELGIQSENGLEPSTWKGPEEHENVTESTKEEDSEEESLRNRRERRLMAKVQAEREANIALNARLQAISEVQKMREETTEADFLKIVEPIFGSTDEKGQYDPARVEATRLFKEALKGAYTTAKKEAIEEALSTLHEEQSGESEALHEEEENIDEGMDYVEEKYGINFSDTNVYNKYLELLEEVSPVNRHGGIAEYAFDAAARLFLADEGKSVSRAKELATRSGTRSGSSQPSELQDQTFYQGLKDLGLID